jgi:hypothetical protein
MRTQALDLRTQAAETGTRPANSRTRERDCPDWYAEATKVFVEGTEIGDLIRSEVPTSSDYNPPTPAAPPTPPPGP